MRLAIRTVLVVWLSLILAECCAFAESGEKSERVELWTTCVLDYGAKADGKTDDTASFQAALDAAAAKGGIAFAPAGTYLIAGSLSVPQGVMLRGVWDAPHHADIGKGTILYATGNKGTEDGPPLILLHQSSGVRGLTIFYPEQDGQSIQPYPWCIQGMGMHGSVINVTLVNPYKGIDFGTHPNELHFISGVFGQPLKIGIFVDKCTDIGRIENVHFNPHAWARADYPTANWDTIEYLKKKLLAEGKTEPRYHPRSRPPLAEAEAANRVIALARRTKCPVYLAHLTCRESLEIVRRAQAQGQSVYAEVCPQHLILSFGFRW